MFKVKDLYIALSSESCDPDNPDALTFLNPNLPPTTQCCDPIDPIAWSMAVPNPWPVFGIPLGGYGFAGLVGYFHSPEMQASLKEYLKAALEQAAKPAEATRKATKPQTVAEVEMLEEKLRAALEELRDRKAELRKAEKK